MSAMFQHPVIAIQTAVQNFSLRTKPITLKLKSGEYEKISEKITQEVKKYTSFIDATIQEFGLEADQTIKKFQEDGKRDILLSALAPDFIEKYQSEIYYEDSFEKLKNFLSEIIGTQSAKSRSKAAKDEMSKITRDSASEEKFLRFLTRLSRLANIVTDDQSVQKFLLAEHFERSLSPALKTFLHEQGKASEEPESIAKFLDKMNKYKRTVDLHSVELTETKEEIHAFMQKKFDELQTEMRKILALQENANLQYSAEINAINKKTTPNQNSKDRHFNDYETFPPEWELNRFGRPFRCRKCGVRGHRDFDCKGTTLSCYLCKKVGHIQPACPKNQRSIAISKN